MSILPTTLIGKFLLYEVKIKIILEKLPQEKPSCSSLMLAIIFTLDSMSVQVTDLNL